MVTAIPDYDFDKYFSNVTSTDLNVMNMTNVGSLAYTNSPLGSIFWGILFSLIFIMIWLRQEDVAIPSILGLIIGLSIWGLMPDDWVSMASSLSIISFFGIMYTLIKGRR